MFARPSCLDKRTQFMTSVPEQIQAQKVIVTYSPDGKSVTISNDQCGTRETFQKDVMPPASKTNCCTNNLFVPMCQDGECSAFDCGVNMFIFVTLPFRGCFWLGKAMLTCVCAPCIGCAFIGAL